MEISVQCHDNGIQLPCPGEYLFIAGLRHMNLAHMSTVIAELTRQFCCIAENALIQDQA